MGTCWGSRCWDSGLGLGLGRADFRWWVPVKLAKSYYLPRVGRSTTDPGGTHLHATAHSRVCLMPELAPGAPFHTVPSVFVAQALPVKAYEIASGTASALHRASSPYRSSIPPTPQACSCLLRDHPHYLLRPRPPATATPGMPKGPSHTSRGLLPATPDAHANAQIPNGCPTVRGPHSRGRGEEGVRHSSARQS